KTVENTPPGGARVAADCSFNAATARRPWRTIFACLRDAAKHSKLQCGHGPKTVENNSLLSGRPMPGTLQCGHGPKTVENALSRLPKGRASWLQCGHGPKTVENDQLELTPIPGRPALQCGHGPKTVENSSAHQSSST